MKNFIKWNNKYYKIDNKYRYFRTKNKHIYYLYQDIWNYYYPNDKILPNDGFVIHHIDGNIFNNEIDNLRKMTHSAHTTLHLMGNQRAKGKHWDWDENSKIAISGTNNPPWKGGFDREKYERDNRKEKLLFSMSDKENHFKYLDIIRTNKKTNKITITHTWKFY